MNDLSVSEPLEKAELNLGFVPLSDCAPLVAAYEKGFFEQEKLRVTLCRERSWASIRDKTAFGVYDAAQMLYPMPLAATLGVGGPAVPMLSALCLSLGGNAITVGQTLHRQMVEALNGEVLGEHNSAMALASVIRSRAAADQPPLTLGCVFPTSTHHYELRQWLRSAEIDCDLDVQLLVVPPPDMPEALRDGRLDGFCVGEPWNSTTVQRGWGRVVMTKHAIWNHGPEKVLGVTRAWAEQHPRTHQALLRSLIAAAAWCDAPENREELVQMIADERYIDAPLEAVRPSLTGRLAFAQDGPTTELPDFLTFHRYAANFPWVSHGRWFIEQMQRAGQIDLNADGAQLEPESIAAAVMRPDLYREACDALGLPYPTIDHRPEGVHDGPWTLTQATAPLRMGPDQVMADPTKPKSIADSGPADRGTCRPRTT